MTVRSNPPGAVVYVDDYEIGTTPVSANFTYYGTRKIRLVKNGYETLTVMQPVGVPWYEFTPLDFMAENLVPGKIRDNRTFDYQLVPERVVPSEELFDRAEKLRRQTRGSGVVQSSPSMPAGAIPRPAAPGLVAPSATPPWNVPSAGAAAPASPTTVAPNPSSGLPPSAWPPSGGASPANPL